MPSCELVTPVTLSTYWSNARGLLERTVNDPRDASVRSMRSVMLSFPFCAATADIRKDAVPYDAAHARSMSAAPPENAAPENSVCQKFVPMKTLLPVLRMFDVGGDCPNAEYCV